MAPTEKDILSWPRYAQHVLSELERLNKQVEDLSRVLSKQRVDIAVLYVKAGIWGLLGGTIPAIGLVLAEVFLKKG